MAPTTYTAYAAPKEEEGFMSDLDKMLANLAKATAELDND